MTKQAPRAAVYARISDARQGDTAGVDRQLSDALALCEMRGYDVVGEFVDNSRSAWKPGGKRPNYDRLMAAVAAGDVDVIVADDTSRLYRQLTDLESLTRTLKAVGARVETRLSGDIDLSSADGQMYAGFLAVVAKAESDKKSERIQRAAQQRSEAGRFSGGLRRFGYNRDCTELDPVESELLRAAYVHVADGGSVRAVWRSWSEKGITGTQGGAIGPAQITQLLKRPMNAGLASYRGEILAGKSQSPALIDVETWQKVQAILSDPARVTVPRGRPAKALMAGFMKCGICGKPVYRHIRTRHRERNAYACNPHKCVTRSGSLVDGFVVQVLGEWLGRNADRISRPQPRKRAPKTDPAMQAQALRQKLDDLALLLAAGDLAAADYARATREVRARLDAVEARIVDEQGLATVRGLADTGDVKAAWETLSVEGKREVISELLSSGVLESITMNPVGRKRDGDPGIVFQWAKK